MLKFRNELIKAQTDAKRGVVYSSLSGCDAQNKNDTKNECAHLEHGCGGKNKHKTAVSKWCLYSKKKGVDLVAAKESWSNALTTLTKKETVTLNVCSRQIHQKVSHVRNISIMFHFLNSTNFTYLSIYNYLLYVHRGKYC